MNSFRIYNGIKICVFVDDIFPESGVYLNMFFFVIKYQYKCISYFYTKKKKKKNWQYEFILNLYIYIESVLILISPLFK